MSRIYDLDVLPSGDMQVLYSDGPGNKVAVTRNRRAATVLTAGFVDIVDATIKTDLAVPAQVVSVQLDIRRRTNVRAIFYEGEDRTDYVIEVAGRKEDCWSTLDIMLSLVVAAVLTDSDLRYISIDPATRELKRAKLDR